MIPLENVPKGRAAMWWVIASEVLIFGGFVTCYLLYRARYPEWAVTASENSIPLGSLNTVLLLISGLCMARANRHAANRNLGGVSLMISLTMLLALGFLGVKSVEYAHKIAHGHLPSTDLFWSFYFGLTGLHALHIVAGILAMAIIMAGARKGRNLQRVEMVGMYWQLVDVVWIFLFTLLYLAKLPTTAALSIAGLIGGWMVFQFVGLKKESKWFWGVMGYAVLCLTFLFLGVYPDVVSVFK